MTLHWWMHWFWITYQICVCYCDVVTSPMHSLSLEFRETTKPPVPNRSVKAVGSSNYIPPITAASATGPPNATAAIPIKLSKSSKKHELHANLTNKSSVTTVHPLVKETTVIYQNITEASSNITDNQTSANTSFNAIINQAENLSYVSDDNGTNQSVIVNSERVGTENRESTKGSLTAAGITGITLGCVSIIGIICAVSFIMYRNYGFNRPQVLNDRCSNPDSSGYIDDSTVRENSEEMYSLDNDSFLNSLEAMTIQNLWTDTVKHTKL